MHKSVNFDELIALYAVSDVCVVSSTRDGMNLVSYEYIACQQQRHGVMVLSEFTGAAQSLNGSLIVNPWNTEELAGALYDAVTMGDEQRAVNFEKLSKYVNKYTSAFWGQSFVAELTKISEQAEKKVRRTSTRNTTTSPGPIVDGDVDTVVDDEVDTAVEGDTTPKAAANGAAN